jgi:hypothetical protein
MGFVEDKVALGQVFSQYFGFPLHNLYSINFSTITITYHPESLDRFILGWNCFERLRYMRLLGLLPLYSH